MDLLRGKFGEHFISRSGLVNYPPRSCDLTPLDHFCGVMIKLMSIRTIPLQLKHWKTTLKHLYVRYRSRKSGKSMPKLDQADGPFEAQSRSTFA